MGKYGITSRSDVCLVQAALQCGGIVATTRPSHLNRQAHLARTVTRPWPRHPRPIAAVQVTVLLPEGHTYVKPYDPDAGGQGNKVRDRGETLMACAACTLHNCTAGDLMLRPLWARIPPPCLLLKRGLAHVG